MRRRDEVAQRPRSGSGEPARRPRSKPVKPRRANRSRHAERNHEGTFSRSIVRTTLAALIPLDIAFAIAWYVVRPRRLEIVGYLLNPTNALIFTIGIGVGALIWLAVIVTTYLKTRPLGIRWYARIGGGLYASVLCLAVAAPLALGGAYAMVTRDLVGTVFEKETVSATTPTITKASPWGNRKRVNLLLLGGDGDVHRYGIRTDSVILVSIEVKTGKTILFSLPRNLRNVPFPENSPLHDEYPDGFHGPDSESAEYFLNAVYNNIPAVYPGILGKSDNEGADAVKQAVSGALGMPVDYYMLVNLQGFEQIVNAIGGVTVNINEPVPIGGNKDANIQPDSYMQPGPNQRLDGFHALWFARGRFGSNDYKRMQRQRCTINAIVDEADPVTLLRRYTSLAATGKKILRTDIPQDLLDDFVQLTGEVKNEPLQSVAFDLTDDFNPNDPDFDYVHRTVQNVLHPPVVNRPTPTDTTDVSTDEPTDEPTDTSTEDPDALKVGSATQADDDCSYQPDDEDSSSSSSNVSASGN